MHGIDRVKKKYIKIELELPRNQKKCAHLCWLFSLLVYSYEWIDYNPYHASVPDDELNRK